MSSVEGAWPLKRRPALPMLIAGIVGLGLCALGAFFGPAAFFRSYLVAYLFWLAFPLGSLALLMVFNMTGGRWGLGLQAIQEAAIDTIPLMALLFVPVALGLDDLYLWTNSYVLEHDAILRGKSPYLNVPAFLLRAAVYFAVWIVVSQLLNLWSTNRRRVYDPVIARRGQVFSGPGLAVLGLTLTFAAIDWIMSLEPHWYSSIFGALIAVAQFLPAFAFGIVMLVWLLGTPAGAEDSMQAEGRRALARLMTPEVWNDLGNLLLAFVMLWAYMGYSQFFLIWSGNLPEEIVWYDVRIKGGWEIVGWSLIVVYFALPFVLLLSRDIKRNPHRLVWVAGLLIVMHLVFQFWLVVPAFSSHGEEHAGGHLAPEGLGWLDLPALVGVGGVWLACFFWRLASHPLAPVADPALKEALAHE